MYFLFFFKQYLLNFTDNIYLDNFFIYILSRNKIKLLQKYLVYYISVESCYINKEIIFLYIYFFTCLFIELHCLQIHFVQK